MLYRANIVGFSSATPSALVVRGRAVQPLTIGDACTLDSAGTAALDKRHGPSRTARTRHASHHGARQAAVSRTTRAGALPARRHQCRRSQAPENLYEIHGKKSKARNTKTAMTTNGEALQPAADRTAIGLSMLCAAHCLLLPIVVVVSPSIAALGIDDESFHFWMLCFVVPVSAYALYVGMRKHRNLRILAIGITGILILGVGAALGDDTLGDVGEKTVTLLGVGLIAFSHLRNYRASQRVAGNNTESRRGYNDDAAD
jgi:hypothetical protein